MVRIPWLSSCRSKACVYNRSVRVWSVTVPESATNESGIALEKHHATALVRSSFALSFVRRMKRRQHPYLHSNNVQPLQSPKDWIMMGVGISMTLITFIALSFLCGQLSIAEDLPYVVFLEPSRYVDSMTVWPYPAMILWQYPTTFCPPQYSIVDRTLPNSAYKARGSCSVRYGWRTG